MSTAPNASRGRLWVRLTRGHRTLRDLTVPCAPDAPQEALREALHTLDISMPVWLPRHQADWEAFRLARFTPEHFVDSVTFDRMDISYIPPETEQRAPRTEWDDLPPARRRS